MEIRRMRTCWVSYKTYLLRIPWGRERCSGPLAGGQRNSRLRAFVVTLVLAPGRCIGFFSQYKHKRSCTACEGHLFLPQKPEPLVMNVEKLKKLQENVRIGGKGTVRRKHKSTRHNNLVDEKKVNAVVKKLGAYPLDDITEVNLYKEDNSAIHFANPRG